MGIPTDITFCFLTLTFYSSISFGLAINPPTHPRVAVLPATFLSCWDVLSDPLIFSCMCLQSTLVYCRLGLPATEINLAYLYKALAFAHLYVPQSCYHKSSCISTSGCMTLTPAILTSLLHFDPLSSCSLKPRYLQTPPKTDMSLQLSVSSLTWLRLD